MKAMYKENQLHLYEELGGDSILGFIIIFIALYFFIYSIIVTQNTMSVANFFENLIEKLQVKNFKCPQEISLPKITPKKRLAKPAAH